MKLLKNKVLFKALFKGTNLFLVLLLIDYTITLFSLNKSAIVISRLGIIFNHVETESYINTSFGVDIKLVISYIIIIFISILFEIIQNRKNVRSTT